jgi:hypothetical protein
MKRKIKRKEKIGKLVLLKKKRKMKYKDIKK